MEDQYLALMIASAFFLAHLLSTAVLSLFRTMLPEKSVLTTRQDQILTTLYSMYTEKDEDGIPRSWTPIGLPESQNKILALMHSFQHDAAMQSQSLSRMIDQIEKIREDNARKIEKILESHSTHHIEVQKQIGAIHMKLDNLEKSCIERRNN